MASRTKTFGSVLQALREERGLSKRALAELIHVNAAHLVRIERDEKSPTAELVTKLAATLKVDREELQANATKELPRLAPYLRAKYDLPDEAVAEMEQHFEAVSRQYKKTKRGRS